MNAPSLAPTFVRPLVPPALVGTSYVWFTFGNGSNGFLGQIPPAMDSRQLFYLMQYSGNGRLARMESPILQEEYTFMDKLSHRFTIRLTENERERLQNIMQQVGADGSSITRLALKRLFRNPPTRRFRFRVKRGAKI